MSINLHLPPSQQRYDGLRPMITVVGVGGAGGNAVNNMITAKLEGVKFVVANTDAQALENARTENVIQIGTKVTGGLGAGANPEMGRAAAEETIEEIAEQIHGSHMVFIAAGMGGGTGTGAAPVIARMAREQGILTIGVITKPFQFEGTHRMKLADAGIKELQDYVDTLIIIPNQNLFRVSNERTTFVDAFRMADEVLHSGVRGITDLMVKPGLVNLDFADIRTVMREMGKAMMGTGEASGERRAIEAAEAAISNPLLDDVSLKGAKAVLINITGGMDMTLFEVDEAANRIRDEVDPDANIIFGSAFNESMNGTMRVSVVATGIDSAQAQQPQPRRTNVFATPEKKPFSLESMRASAKPAYESQPQREAPYQQFQAGERPAAPAPVRETVSPRDSFDFGYQEQRPAAAAPVSEEAVVHEQPRAFEPRLHSEPVMQHPVEEPRYEREPARFEGRREEPREEEDSGAFGFLQKMAGVGKVLSRSERPEPERTVQVLERPKVVEKKEVSATQASDEEYLDIPAFLRRQAN